MGGKHSSKETLRACNIFACFKLVEMHMKEKQGWGGREVRLGGGGGQLKPSSY